MTQRHRTRAVVQRKRTAALVRGRLLVLGPAAGGERREREEEQGAAD
jgi:hypothetical protein